MSDEFLSQFSTVEQRRDRVGDLMAQILQKKKSVQAIRNRIPINLEIPDATLHDVPTGCLCILRVGPLRSNSD